MNLAELFDIISQKSGGAVNQSQLADCLGVTRQTVSNRIKNSSQVTVSELEKVEKYFKIPFFGSDDCDDVVSLDFYTDVFASCGNGNVVFSDEKEKVRISSALIGDYSKNKKYSVITAKGNSMTPTIENGDRLIVEHWEGNRIQDNKIYVFCFNDEFFVKRLSKNLDEIIIKSDNPDYRIRTISGSTADELRVAGKIVGIIKSL